MPTKFELSKDIEKSKEYSEKEEIVQEELNSNPVLYLKLISLLKKETLCFECLGRQFSYLATGTDNATRAKSLLLSLSMECHKLVKMSNLEKKYTLYDHDPLTILKYIGISTQFKPAILTYKKLTKKEHYKKKFINFPKFHICSFCENLLKPNYIEIIFKKIKQAIKSYEFDNFLVGTYLNPILTNKEEEFRARYKIQSGESFKANLNRIIGKKIQDFTGKDPKFSRPHLTIMIDLRPENNIEIELQSLPIYIKGRYLKFSRDLPQTKWKCQTCYGTGIIREPSKTCSDCKGTGRIYNDSIHEILARHIQEKINGTDSVFHGAGREDINTRCLGRGREFIIEIKNPQLRTTDLLPIEKRINEKHQKILIVKNLCLVEKTQVSKVKSFQRLGNKKYRVLVALDTFFDTKTFHEKIQKIQKKFTDCKIFQRTPLRIIHRKPDTTKQKTIYKVTGKIIDPMHIVFNISAESGTYIKEFITGDGNRTGPSIQSFFDSSLRVIELDVIKIQ